MISEIYKNRMLYYNFMKDFLDGKIIPWEFRKKYWHQRNGDLDINKESGYRDYYLSKVFLGNEKIFEEEYADFLYQKSRTNECLNILQEYEKGANELNIVGEDFFMGIWNFIDEYVREYYPSDNDGFDPASDVDEQTLTKIIRAVFDVLERNKDRWQYDEDESIKI